jgi:hypothetical protein
MDTLVPALQRNDISQEDKFLRFWMTESTPNTGSPNDGSATPDASEGLRLMKAFLNITKRDARASVIELAERLAGQRGSNGN